MSGGLSSCPALFESNGVEAFVTLSTRLRCCFCDSAAVNSPPFSPNTAFTRLSPSFLDEHVASTKGREASRSNLEAALLTANGVVGGKFDIVPKAREVTEE
jgi:hypothetical protein